MMFADLSFGETVALIPANTSVHNDALSFGVQASNELGTFNAKNMNYSTRRTSNLP